MTGLCEGGNEPLSSLKASKCNGVRREGTNLFCGIMNMPPPSSRFSALNNHLLDALEIESRNSMSDAVKEAVVMNSELREENDSGPVTDLAVSCVGTWMKRGHTSFHCVTSVISIDTGKILDLERLGFDAGVYILKILKMIYDRRIASSKLSAQSFSRQSRQENQLKRKFTEELQGEDEYGYGQH
ncbi:hypothetical protein ANN_09373 [Periplaneta americana]|uniref:Mutator-like transposase domain-containing protein n=1 Tax=Periplaneta americana TaxID=6978 RepID=A0ABQ8TMX0_PERAM|nr:hypothetical protein ANN_09373 [Periplaneta americana]